MTSRNIVRYNITLYHSAVVLGLFTFCSFKLTRSLAGSNGLFNNIFVYGFFCPKFCSKIQLVKLCYVTFIQWDVARDFATFLLILLEIREVNLLLCTTLYILILHVSVFILLVIGKVQCTNASSNTVECCESCKTLLNVIRLKFLSGWA